MEMRLYSLSVTAQLQRDRGCGGEFKTAPPQ